MELLPGFVSKSDLNTEMPVRLFQGKFGPEHGLVDREGDADVDNARAPSGNIPDEKEQSRG